MPQKEQMDQRIQRILQDLDRVRENLLANSLRDHMKLLLQEFGIEESTMTIYLRQDRDADA